MIRSYGPPAGYPLVGEGVLNEARFRGATAAGPPTSGTFNVGDFVISHTGNMYICVAAGTPGSWEVSGKSELGNAVKTDDQNMNTAGTNPNDLTGLSFSVTSRGRPYWVILRAPQLKQQVAVVYAISALIRNASDVVYPGAYGPAPIAGVTGGSASLAGARSEVRIDDPAGTVKTFKGTLQANNASANFLVQSSVIYATMTAIEV